MARASRRRTARILGDPTCDDLTGKLRGTFDNDEAIKYAIELQQYLGGKQYFSRALARPAASTWPGRWCATSACSRVCSGASSQALLDRQDSGAVGVAGIIKLEEGAHTVRPLLFPGLRDAYSRGKLSSALTGRGIWFVANDYWSRVLRRRISRRRTLLAGAATTFGAAFLVACGGDDDSTSTGYAGSTPGAGATGSAGATVRPARRGRCRRRRALLAVSNHRGC